MKIKHLLILVFFVILVCFCLFLKKGEYKIISDEKERFSYFNSFPIEKYTCINTPCVNILINEKPFLAELDLGFRGGISVSSCLLDELEEKTIIDSRTLYGVRGLERKVNQYSISSIEMGQMQFFPPIIEDGHEPEFFQQALLVRAEHSTAKGEGAMIGWQLVSSVNLLLDCKNSQVAFCDSIDTLMKHGYFLTSFVKTPFFLDRGLVEIEVISDHGKLKCALDTGATWDIINRDVEKIDPEKREVYAVFEIGGENFGPMDLCQIPIKLPIHIEAVLGMEFFSEHVVFLDFKNLQAYIYKASKKTDDSLGLEKNEKNCI